MCGNGFRTADAPYPVPKDKTGSCTANSGINVVEKFIISRYITDIMRVFSEQLRVRYRDVNREGRIKASSWFGFMQEIAVDHASALKFGYHDMAALGVFWVLARLRLSIVRQPTVEDTLTLETWPGAFRRLFAARHFRFLDRDGAEAATASSQWMILSLRDQRPQRVDIVGDKMPDTSDLPAYYDFSERLATVKPEGPGQDFPVRFSMEDVNGHLNNAEYMALAQDAVESELGRPARFSGLEVAFHAAVRAPEHLSLYTARDGSGHLVGGYRKDGTLSFCAALRGTGETTTEHVKI